jgi:hypothetical protein
MAGLIDQTFGSEGDWELAESKGFGDLEPSAWRELRSRALGTLGRDQLANLLVLGEEGRCVFLPAQVHSMTLPLSTGCRLRCASLPGLRRELAELAAAWDLPLDDDALRGMLESDGSLALADPPEVLAFARLALAANEAVRRDCPLWLCMTDES